MHLTKEQKDIVYSMCNNLDMDDLILYRYILEYMQSDMCKNNKINSLKYTILKKHLNNELIKYSKGKNNKIPKIMYLIYKLKMIENSSKYVMPKYIYISLTIICIFFALNVFSYIFAGVNIFNVKNYINKDNITTEFSRKGGDKNNDTEITYESFKDIKRDFKITFLEPTYLPSNYILEEILVNKNDKDNKLQISAKYMKEQKTLIYNIFIFLTGNVKAKFSTEKTEDNASIEIKDGIEYIYSSNYDWNTLKWVDANVAYIISCSESKEELYRIVKNLKEEK